MSDSKEAQAARNEVDRALRAENRERYEALMVEAFAKRGLTWNRRLTKEERAEREAEERKAKTLARIQEVARTSGLSHGAIVEALGFLNGEEPAEEEAPEVIVHPDVHGVDHLPVQAR